MIPQKSHYSVANDIVYISVTFDGDEKAREFVAKMFLCFKSQKKAVVIEDASLNLGIVLLRLTLIITMF